MARVEPCDVDARAPGGAGALGALAFRLRQAIDRAAAYLVAQQAPDGYWLGELQADTTLESDYVLYLHVLNRPSRVWKLANYVRRRQLADGGWNIYEGGPSELNATVKAYLALKLAGDSQDAPHMRRACGVVHRLGGLERTNSFTRFYLALVGAIGWDMVPAVPPEIVSLPPWFPANIYAMSSWTRAIVVPLTILYACKPRWQVPSHAGVGELLRNPADRGAAFAWDRQVLSWRNFFLIVDRLAKLCERVPWKPFRRRALGDAEGFLLEHLERSDGLAAIYPAMMNSVFALLALGRAPEDPIAAREIAALERLEIEDADTLRLQPCVSPVWDTAIAMDTLRAAGLAPDDPCLVRAASWLLDRQILGPGDWRLANPEAQPGGWAFEFRNDFYPDVDDTAFVLMALRGVAYPDPLRLQTAIRRGLRWMISMQNRDGGWGAFDRNNDFAVLTRIPFADHNAMIDPSSADVTARVVECLGAFGWSSTDPVIARALEYLRREQTPDGAWYGRWGVNYIYGTSGVIRALAAMGLGHSGQCRRAVDWVRGVQNRDGGFGESCASYDDPALKGRGESTASQTAWGLIALLEGGAAHDPATARAAQYLLDRQSSDGSWSEEATTGTGFPRVFYLKYHLYRNSFPLYALARYHGTLRRAWTDDEAFVTAPARGAMAARLAAS